MQMSAPTVRVRPLLHHRPGGQLRKLWWSGIILKFKIHDEDLIRYVVLQGINNSNIHACIHAAGMIEGGYFLVLDKNFVF